jgi:hypothetical protein
LTGLVIGSSDLITTQPDEFQVLPQPDGTNVNLVNDGSAAVTLANPDGSPATISIPTGSLLKPPLKFLHDTSRSHGGA